MNAETCEVENGGCEDVCVDTVQGPRCSCSPGLLLNDTDKRTCIGKDLTALAMYVFTVQHPLTSGYTRTTTRSCRTRKR